jgi:UDP-2-acetamido-2,6-beta-L-arabino-hexul-4-ose reductase
MELEIREFDAKDDERGIFIEILKSNEIKEQIKEVLLIVSKPGVVRGNHYHEKKAEWLCLLKGKAKFLYIDIETGEKKELVIDNKPTIIKTPLRVAHATKNIGKDDLYLLEISNHLYSEDPDMFRKEIM